MNKLPLTVAALAVLQAAAVAGPVPVTAAALTYTQNFDSLGTANVDWTDDSTIPGWFAQINNRTTDTGSARAADGTVILSGLLNLGTTAAPDRALGSKATGTGNLANIAYAVSFQNQSPGTVALTQLQYTGELWRTNTGTGTPLVAVDEEFAVYFQVSGTALTDIQSGGTANPPVPGPGFNALGAGANWINPVNTPLATATAGALDGNAPANRTSVTFSPSGVTLLPGQFLTIKWTDANEGGTDGYPGIDDVTVSFTGVDGVLTPSVSNLTRHANSTPANPADDSFGFTVNVTGTGTGIGSGWTAATVTPPPGNATSGPYGANVTWTGFPVPGPKAVTFTDNANALLTADISVDPPKVIGTSVLTNENVISSGAPPAQWVIDETAQTLTMTNGGGAPAKTLTAAPVNLATVSGVVRLSALLDVRDTSSGFETPDTFLARLVLHDGVSDTTVNLITAYDTDASGVMQGAELAPGGGTVAAPTLRTYALSHNIPDNMVSARLVISGNNDSPNETMIVSGIRLDIAPRSISISAPANIMRHENGPGLADDTVSFEVVVTGINAGASWTASGAAPASGAYGPVIFTVPVTASPAVVTITDVSFPAATQNVSVAIPIRYTIGFQYYGSGPQDLFSAVNAPPAIEWTNDPLRHTLDMSAGGNSTDKTVLSDVLDLTARGTVHFSGRLHARETSSGTNFEMPDRFKAELIMDGGTPGETIINLISAYDAGDGASSTAVATGGLNGPPDGYLNGYNGTAARDLISNITYTLAEDEYNANRGRDEFNRGNQAADDSINNLFPLEHTIPPSANTVQLRVSGAAISGSEFFTVSRVLFSSVPATADTDGDGITDYNELLDGTDPNNPASLLTISTLTTGPGGSQVAGFPTVAGRVYRGYFSTGLATWTRDDSVPPVTGDGTVQNWMLPALPAPAARHYLKVLAGFSAAEFPATLP